MPKYNNYEYFISKYTRKEYRKKIDAKNVFIKNPLAIWKEKCVILSSIFKNLILLGNHRLSLTTFHWKHILMTLPHLVSTMSFNTVLRRHITLHPHFMTMNLIFLLQFVSRSLGAFKRTCSFSCKFFHWRRLLKTAYLTRFSIVTS